jgi:membrane protease YdiL (CAAX protease family)
VWHDRTVPFQQYHRAGHANRWKAVLEPVLALVFTFVLMAVAISIELGIFGVKKLGELPTEVRTFTTFANIALLVPGTLLAARACGRRAASLWSVKYRVRWRWLVTCLLAALAVRAIAPVLITLDLVFGRKDFIGAAEYLPRLAAVLVLVPIQATGEELFYRGSVMQAVGSFTRSAWPPIIISTALFTLAHGFRLELALAIAPMGLACAWLTIRTGGLEAGMGYHIALNTVSLALELAIAGGKRGINEDPRYVGAVVSAVFIGVYVLVVLRSAKRLPPGSDQVEEDPPEPGVRVEHADHRGDAEPLPPEQQQTSG